MKKGRKEEGEGRGDGTVKRGRDKCRHWNEMRKGHRRKREDILTGEMIQ